MDGAGIRSHRVQRALETDSSKVRLVRASGFLHEQPDQVIGDDVQEGFPFDQFRAFAAQDVQSEQDFDLVKSLP